MSNNVKELQYQLNLQGFTDADGNKLVVDGIVGPKTLQACDKCTVQIGASGGITKWIQNTLISKGYSLAPYGADGVFGKVTLNAVKQFQANNGLVPDGIVGPRTWRALLK